MLNTIFALVNSHVWTVWFICGSISMLSVMVFVLIRDRELTLSQLFFCIFLMILGMVSLVTIIIVLLIFGTICIGNWANSIVIFKMRK